MNAFFREVKNSIFIIFFGERTQTNFGVDNSERKAEYIKDNITKIGNDFFNYGCAIQDSLKIFNLVK